jgi:hypothetical protein
MWHRRSADEATLGPLANYDFVNTPINGRGEGIFDRKSLAKPCRVLISTWPAPFFVL